MSSVVKAVAGAVLTVVGVVYQQPYLTSAGVGLMAGGASEKVAERKAEKREESQRNMMAEQQRRASEETAGVKEAARRQSELMTKRRGFASTILTSPTGAVGSVPGTKTTLG
jgi:flagellar biosynthesis component FlhA